MAKPTYCLSVRLGEDAQAQLERLSAAWGLNVSDVVRRLLEDAARLPLPSGWRARQLQLPKVPK